MNGPVLMMTAAVIGLMLITAATSSNEDAGNNQSDSQYETKSTVIAGQDIPDISLSGYMSDNADVIKPADELDIIAKISEFSRSGNGEMAVLTVKSLNGLSVEEFGIRVGEKWKVGRAGKDDGIIIIVATVDRKVRIEVGRGASITDAQAGEVLDNFMIPKLKAGNWAGGISDSVDELIKLAGK